MCEYYCTCDKQFRAANCDCRLKKDISFCEYCRIVCSFCGWNTCNAKPICRNCKREYKSDLNTMENHTCAISFRLSCAQYSELSWKALEELQKSSLKIESRTWIYQDYDSIFSVMQRIGWEENEPPTAVHICFTVGNMGIGSCSTIEKMTKYLHKFCIEIRFCFAGGIHFLVTNGIPKEKIATEEEWLAIMKHDSPQPPNRLPITSKFAVIS